MYLMMKVMIDRSAMSISVSGIECCLWAESGIPVADVCRDFPVCVDLVLYHQPDFDVPGKSDPSGGSTEKQRIIVLRLDFLSR